MSLFIRTILLLRDDDDDDDDDDRDNAIVTFPATLSASSGFRVIPKNTAVLLLCFCHFV